MQVLILDGHPDAGRLSSQLLDAYEAALPDHAGITRIALRELEFDPILHRGQAAPQPLEPDLQAAWDAIVAADHLVIGFPLWWSAEPALLKGFWDRVLLRDAAYRLGPSGRALGLLNGRSADLLITTGTPPLVLQTLLGDVPGRRAGPMILGFCGITSIRSRYFGPTENGDVAARLPLWQARAQRLARTAEGRWRGAKR